MIRHDLAIVNQSSVIDDVRGLALTKAVATQISRDFAPAWGINARLTYVPLGAKPTAGKWWVVLMDNSDEAGALGYHDLTPEGLPIGKVFARTDQRYGLSVGVTLSHEVLEQLADPYINLTVMVQESGGQAAYAYENCDACEADQLGYTIGNELVSDFVYPRYFDPTATGAKLDHGGHIAQPFQILPGGYLSKWTPTGGWTQLHGSQAAPGDRPRVGSRRDRRRTPRQDWLVSKPLDWQSGSPLYEMPEHGEDIEVEN